MGGGGLDFFGVDGFEGGWGVDGDVPAHAEDPLEDVEVGFVSGGADGKGDFKSGFHLFDALPGMEDPVGEEIGHGGADVQAEGFHAVAVAKAAKTALNDGFWIETGVGLEGPVAFAGGLDAVELELADFVVSVVAGEQVPVALHVDDVMRVDLSAAGFGGTEAVVLDFDDVMCPGCVQEHIPDARLYGEYGGGCEAEDAAVAVVGVDGNPVFQFPGDFIKNRLQGGLNGGAAILGDGLTGDEEAEEFAFGEGDLGEEPTGFGEIVAVAGTVIGDGGVHLVAEAVENAGDGAGADFEGFRNLSASGAFIVFEPFGDGDEVNVLAAVESGG